MEKTKKLKKLKKECPCQGCRTCFRHKWPLVLIHQQGHTWHVCSGQHGVGNRGATDTFGFRHCTYCIILYPKCRNGLGCLTLSHLYPSSFVTANSTFWSCHQFPLKLSWESATADFFPSCEVKAPVHLIVMDHITWSLSRMHVAMLVYARCCLALSSFDCERLIYAECCTEQFRENKAQADSSLTGFRLWGIKCHRQRLKFYSFLCKACATRRTHTATALRERMVDLLFLKV